MQDLKTEEPQDNFGLMDVSKFQKKFGSDHDIETIKSTVKTSVTCAAIADSDVSRENYKLACDAVTAKTPDTALSIMRAYPKEPGGDVHELIVAGNDGKGIYHSEADPDGVATKQFQSEQKNQADAGPQVAAPTDGFKVSQSVSMAPSMTP